MKRALRLLLLLPFFLLSAQVAKPYKIVDFSAVSQQDDIMLCATLDRYFWDNNLKAIKNYIQVIPRTNFSVSANYDRLCIKGLKPQTEYAVEFKAALPLGEQHLDRDYHFTKKTGNYRPSMRFKESGYILPSKGDITIPLESRNVDRVSVSLYRINQNNLINAINENSLRDQLDKYQLNIIKYESGYLLWTKRLSIDALLNKKTVTAIPVGDALKKTKPGVYILAASLINAKGEVDDYSVKTQWFMVSDVGIYTQKGAKKLHIYTKHLSNATPYNGVKIEVVAKNNELLATTTTKNGYAEIESRLLEGKDALAPRALYAYGRNGDFSVLDFSRPKLDLSDRGDAGRLAPHHFDAYIYSNRGIFKPGERVSFYSLVKTQLVKAASNLTLSAKLINDSGKVVALKSLKTDAFGYLHDSFALPNKVGRYTILLYADSSTPIGSFKFLVQDFVPPKIEMSVATLPDAIEPFTSTPLRVVAKYLTGDVMPNPKADFSIGLRTTKEPYKEYKGYFFGRASEEMDRYYIADGSLNGNAKGVVEVPLRIDEVMNTSLPLIAYVKVHILEPGGRGVQRVFKIPYNNQSRYIGIKPEFDNGAISLGAKPSFRLIYLEKRKPISGTLKWRLIEQEPNWNWRYNDNNEWEYYRTYEDIKTVASGSVKVSEQPTPLTLQKLDWGSYRLEVYDESGVVSSYYFSSGYEESASKASPDRLPISLNKQHFAPGEVIKAQITPKFSGPVVVNIASSAILQTKELQAKANKPITVRFKVNKEWGSSFYLLATQFRAQSKRLGATRAVGLSHIAVSNSDDKIDIAMNYPKQIHSQSTLQVKLHSGGIKSQKVKVVVAAVDRGILNLTRFKAPDPFDYFYGQRQLGVELRDIYSELIKTSGAHAEFDVGSGDEEEEELNGPVASNRRKIVALFSDVATFDKNGDAQVAFKVPDFQGSLKLMAVAWGKKGVGSAIGTVLVKDPITTELYMPRFLSVGDKASILAQARFDKKVPNGTYKLKMQSSGGATIEPKEATLEVGSSRDFTKSFTITAKSLQDANITLRIYRGTKVLASRNFALATRLPYVKTRLRRVGILDAKAILDTKSAIDTNKWEHIQNITLTLSSAPLLAIKSMQEDLIRYCCRCAEQTTSRGYAFIDDPKEKELVKRSIQRLYELQKYGGGFGLWENSKASMWVTSYVLDFLTRAKEAGFTVSKKRIESGLRYLQQHLTRWSKDPQKIEADIYALYVLARNKHILSAEIAYHAKNPGTLSGAGWAYLAASMKLIGEDAKARVFFNRAKQFLYHTSDYFYNFGGSLRDKALIVVLASQAGYKDIAQSLFVDLALDSKERDYLSTQEMSMIIRAKKSVDVPSASMHIKVGSKEINGKKFQASYKSVAAMPQVDNLGNSSLWYSIDAIAAANMANYTESENRGFHIEKHLYTLDGKPVDLQNIAQGERIVVVIKGSVEDSAILHPLILDLLPSGFEIENPAISGFDETDSLKWIGQKSAADKQEYRDDRYIAALVPNGKGAFKVAYSVRAVTKGEFALAPTLIEDMYKPYYRALSLQQTGTIVIKDASTTAHSTQGGSGGQDNNQTQGLSSSDYTNLFNAPAGNLARYSTIELYDLRNGIFAQAGLDFKTRNPNLHKLFLNYKWYKPTQESSSAVYKSLSQLQKQNVQALLKEEKRRLGGLVFADFYRIRVKEMTQKDLKKYSKAQLRILRNSLIARYGYVFKDKKLRSIFNNLPWYKPDPTKTASEIIDTLMNQLERANLNAIIEAEKAAK